MTDRVFFYGTLMTGFNRRLRIGVDSKLRYVGRGSIQAILFDLGIYPAAVPGDGHVWGELFETDEPELVLAGLDSIEGYRPGDPEHSLYTRVQSPVTLEDGRTLQAWVYFYNAPLGQASQILSGDYLQYLEKDKHK
ncbi:MAG TPA: gamma-glutamylcyclotransferase family protein [Vicinamibacterales bacterium]|jgi:gamma-glutamylcyclotransferase (GGCT)/AIG2-like uncharacterized protein YtfP